jgi:hypothetical protein
VARRLRVKAPNQEIAFARLRRPKLHRSFAGKLTTAAGLSSWRSVIVVFEDEWLETIVDELLGKGRRLKPRIYTA